MGYSIKLCEIVKILKVSVKELYSKDGKLLILDGKPRNGMEQACAFRIGHYFCNNVKDTEFQSYDIDMEYNKNSHLPKLLIGNEHGKRPDLIVHKRGHNKDNLLIVEFKHGGNEIDEDIFKLKRFTSPVDEYKYKLGVLIRLGNTFESVNYQYFHKEKEVILHEIR